jgi:integrase
VKLWRRRHAELTDKGDVGARGAEVTVSRLLTIAEWLRSEELIDELACRPWKDGKAKMREEAGAPDPQRPRHTLAEARAILAAGEQVDPRFGLALLLGAELRGGQVLRGRRSDLDLEANTFRVRGRGKKQGTIVHLTKGQRAAVDRALGGYLSLLEAAAIDYTLFPAGKLVGRTAEGGQGGGSAPASREGHPDPGRPSAGGHGSTPGAARARAGCPDRAEPDR